MLSLLACLVLCGGAAAQTPEEVIPAYPEEAEGETAVWVDAAGVAGWVTERSPVGAFAPVVAGLGVSHRVGVARLAWRVHLLTAFGEAGPLRFVYGDLLSIERVHGEGWWRPYWRVALGFGLDLEGGGVKLGADGYFNEDSGAAGGLALTGGVGFDAFFTDALFLKLDATARVHGGVGRNGVLGVAHLGVGRTF